MNRKHDPNTLLQKIIDHKVANDGRFPTFREMCSWFHTSPAVIYGMLNRLEESGKITVDGQFISVVGGRYVPPN